MSSEIKATNYKAKDGTAGISIADSTGNVTTSGTLTATGSLTASGGIANAGNISAGTIGTGVTINAGSNVSGIGQLVGVGVGGGSGGDDTNEVTIDVNKNYLMWIIAWNNNSQFVHMEVFTAVGNGSSHTFTQNASMTGSLGVGVGSSGGNGTCQGFTDSPFSYCQMLVFEQGTGFDIS